MPGLRPSLFPALRWFSAVGLLAGGLALGPMLGLAPDAHAAAPDAAKVRTAASEFDLGVKALDAKDFAVAAAHFEAADAAVPSDKALRRAILARADAGQGSRAATLAALALARHPDNANAVKLANDTLAKFGPALHKVQIRCAPPCILAVGTRAVHGEATTRWTVYLDPGPAQLSASFASGSSASAQVKARAGGETELRLEPPAGAAPPQPEPTAPRQPESPSPAGAPEPAPRTRSGLPVWVFPLGLVATAGAGGALVWSGLDTLENPGADAVREGCVGLGPSCPLYQQGLDAQLRTNVLIGVTGGLGAVTAVLIGFTDFGGKAPAKSASAWRATSFVPVALSGGGLGVAAAGQF